MWSGLRELGPFSFQKPTPVGIEKAFTMPISQALLEIVPVGEENAVSGRLLWKQLGMWSAESIKHKLNQLAAEGLIERRRIVDRSRETSLYFRVRT